MIEKDQGKYKGYTVGAGIVVVLLLLGLTGGGMMMGPFMMLGGPLLIVLLVAWLARGGALSDLMSAWDRPRGESARDILDARYARGELTDEQYDQMRRELGQASAKHDVSP